MTEEQWARNSHNVQLNSSLNMADSVPRVLASHQQAWLDIQCISETVKTLANTWNIVVHSAAFPLFLSLLEMKNIIVTIFHKKDKYIRLSIEPIFRSYLTFILSFRRQYQTQQQVNRGSPLKPSLCNPPPQLDTHMACYKYRSDILCV